MYTEKNFKNGRRIAMTIYDVLSTMTIGDNTAVIIDGSGELFRNGIGVLDKNGKPYEVLSVGMDCALKTDDILNKTSLLLKGNFLSKKMFV